MRNIIIRLSILMSLGLPEILIAQSESHWVPKQYVEEILVNFKIRDFSALIKPIQYISCSEKGIFFQSFGGEKKKVSYVRLSNDCLKITNAASLINLKYLDKEYTKKDFILKINKESIILYVGNGNNLERFDFIDRINGFKFFDFEESIFRLQFSGNYLEVIKSDSNKVQFHIDGSIRQSRFWSAYDLSKKNAKMVQDNTLYRLVSFKDKDQKRAGFAAILKDNYLLLYKLTNERAILPNKEADYKYLKSY